jgi:hypothetical protein
MGERDVTATIDASDFPSLHQNSSRRKDWNPDNR